MSCAGVAEWDSGFDVIRDPWQEDGFTCSEDALLYEETLE